MRKIYLLVLLFVSIFSNAQLQGQDQVDSLLIALKSSKIDTSTVKTLNKLAEVLDRIDKKQGLTYATKGKNLAEKIGFKRGLADAYRCLANNSEGQLKLKYFEKALELAKETKFLKLQSLVYSNLAAFYNYEGKFDLSLENNFKALEIFELQKNYLGIASTYLNIGVMYIYLKEIEKALQYLKKALVESKKINNPYLNATINDNISVIYQDKKEFEKAIPYNKIALKIFRELKINNNIAVSLGNLSSSYFNLKEYDLAEKFSKEAIEISKQIDDSRILSFSMSTLSSIFLSKYENEKSIGYYKNEKYLNEAIQMQLEAIKQDKSVNDIQAMFQNYEILSKAYKLKGNFKESLAAHEQYVIYKDSVFNADNKETIKNLEDKREIELRDNQIKINQLEINSKEKQKWYLFGGLGLLTVIGGLLFYQSRKRKQVNQKLELLNQNLDAKNLELDQANKAKTRFFGILNHDLRGPVSNLVFFLQLQQESPEMLDSESIKRMQDKTMTGAENLLSTMEDILQWSKSQMENFKPQPKNFPVKQLFDDTKKVFSGYLKISFEYQNPENLDVYTDENYLKTIIRNLTSNAINVFTNTEKPKIVWKAWQEDNKIYFSIQDNGPGASQEQLKALFEDTEISSAKSGLGLYLIRDMAKAINCEISVDSKIGVGTTFILKI